MRITFLIESHLSFFKNFEIMINCERLTACTVNISAIFGSFAYFLKKMLCLLICKFSSLLLNDLNSIFYLHARNIFGFEVSF